MRSMCATRERRCPLPLCDIQSPGRDAEDTGSGLRWRQVPTPMDTEVWCAGEESSTVLSRPCWNNWPWQLGVAERHGELLEVATQDRG